MFRCWVRQKVAIICLLYTPFSHTLPQCKAPVIQKIQLQSGFPRASSTSRVRWQSSVWLAKILSVVHRKYDFPQLYISKFSCSCHPTSLIIQGIQTHQTPQTHIRDYHFCLCESLCARFLLPPIQRIMLHISTWCTDQELPENYFWQYPRTQPWLAWSAFRESSFHP